MKLPLLLSSNFLLVLSEAEEVKKTLLGLNLVSFAAHVANILILFIVLRFLLYKPIKKFMDNRENAYNQREQETANNEKKVKELKEKYESKVKDAKFEADTIVLDSRKDANKRADEIIRQAKLESDELIEQARKDIQEERANAKIAMQEEVADLAVGIATRVLEREVSAEDNKRIIDSFLEKKRIN